MWPYFLLIFIIFVLNFRFGNRSFYKQKFIFGIILLIGFAACRSNDYDYMEYIIRGQNIFTIRDVFNNNTHMEPGYCLIALIVNRFHLPEQFKIFAMNFIGLSCLSIMIRKISPNWILSLLVHLPIYFTFDMQTARAAVAIEISSLGAVYMLEKNYKAYFLTLLAACFFHQSAVVTLLLIPLAYIDIKREYGIIFLFVEMLFVKLIGVDRVVLAILQATKLNSLYSKYLGYTNSAFSYVFHLWDIRLWLLILLFVVAKWVFVNPSKLEKYMTNCIFVSAAILVFFSEHTIFAIRLSSFFNVYSIILVPLIVNRITKDKKTMTTAVHSFSIGNSKKQVQFLIILMYTMLAVAYAMQKTPYTVYFMS